MRHVHVRRGKLELGEETHGESNCHGRRNCCIQGYHVYKAVWKAVLGESLVCEGDPKNASICYGCEKGTMIGHLPRKVSQVCFLFLRREGTIECTVTGCRKYSADLAQGEHKVPCSLPFKAMLMEPVG